MRIYSIVVLYETKKFYSHSNKDLRTHCAAHTHPMECPDTIVFVAVDLP